MWVNSSFRNVSICWRPVLLTPLPISVVIHFPSDVCRSNTPDCRLARLGLTTVVSHNLLNSVSHAVIGVFDHSWLDSSGGNRSPRSPYRIDVPSSWTRF